MDYGQMQDLFMVHWQEAAKALGAYVFGVFTWLLARIFKATPKEGREIFQSVLQALKSPTACKDGTHRQIWFEGGCVQPDASWGELVLLKLATGTALFDKASHLFTRGELRAIHKASLAAIKQWRIDTQRRQEKIAVTCMQGGHPMPHQGGMASVPSPTSLPAHSPSASYAGPAMVVCSMGDNGLPVQGLPKR